MTAPSCVWDRAHNVRTGLSRRREFSSFERARRLYSRTSFRFDEEGERRGSRLLDPLRVVDGRFFEDRRRMLVRAWCVIITRLDPCFPPSADRLTHPSAILSSDSFLLHSLDDRRSYAYASSTPHPQSLRSRLASYVTNTRTLALRG